MSQQNIIQSCIFECGKSGELEAISQSKINSIIIASQTRNDNFHVSLESKDIINPNILFYCHRNCYSTYTSKTHINRVLKRCAQDDIIQTGKRVLRSAPSSFDFKSNCLLCGEKCAERDPKNPNRHYPIYMVRTIEMKPALIETCERRSDKWGEDVRLRISGASCDLVAAEARYHPQCYKQFSSVKYINKKHSDSDKDDYAFKEVILEMKMESNRTWNSIQLHSLYLSRGGIMSSRRKFVTRLENFFGKELLVLSSNGNASLILFRKACTADLVTTEDDFDNITGHIKALAAQIKKETQCDTTKYQIRINDESIKAECSKTLLELLEELKIPNLAALTIGSIVSSCLENAPSQLQVAITNLIERKSLIKELSKFKITTTYDEYNRFRSSLAKVCTTDTAMRGIGKGNGLVQVVADNFDATLCSENGLKQTHAMGMILTKYPNVTLKDAILIPRLSKAESRLPPDLDIPTERYKGPKKVPMPQSMQMNGKEFPSLKKLALKACQNKSLLKAQNDDFKFLKAITRDPNNTPEYNGFNSKLSRNSLPAVKATEIAYLPLLDQPPTNHDTVLTTMIELRRTTNECAQSYVVFTADQAIYKVVIDIIWNDLEKFSDFVPRLGGMHTLMSFIGCVGTLMSGSGLVEVLETAFAGVSLMLKGKKFPQNMRALRIVAEEILRPVLEDINMTDFDSMMKELENKSCRSRTTRLWVDCFIKPVFIMMNFVRAEREGDWCLHVWCVLQMLPYFASAGHWNYLRYAFVYLSFMDKIPRECLDQFLRGEHVMRHKEGTWNGIWSDQMIESTFMRYGHGERGSSLTGITLNSAAVKRWTLNMHATSQLKQDIHDIGRQQSDNEAIIIHKEEQKGRIRRDNEDRLKISKKLEVCIQPLDESDHPEGLINIVTGKVATDAVNVEQAHQLGSTVVQQFQESLPEGFYVPLKKCVLNMSEKKNKSKSNAPQLDSTLLYSRVIALQSNREVKMQDVLKYELSSFPPSMFKDGAMRDASGKSVLMNTLAVSHSTRTTTPPNLVIIDGCALLWTVHWPAGGIVLDFMKNFLHKLMYSLQTSDVNLIFDRYFDHSIKSSTRNVRASQGCRKFILNEKTPLPSQSAILTNTDNKKQLIELLVKFIINEVAHLFIQNRLLITGENHVPVEVQRDVIISRHDLKITHEEADTIIIHQLLEETKDRHSGTVHVMCDDTDVFVLLLYYCLQFAITNDVYMVSFKAERSIVDIQATIKKHRDIIPSLPAAHALSGCDSVPPLFGIGKKKVIKTLKSGLKLLQLGNIEKNIEEILEESVLFMTSCYGFREMKDMTQARIAYWGKKVGQAQLRAPSFSSIPPTSESFKENVKRAHLQSILWLSAHDGIFPSIDPTLFGWKMNQENSLVPVPIPKNTCIAPDYIISMTKCSCKTDEPCSSGRCSCRGNGISCSIMCQCLQEDKKCYNPHTMVAETFSESDFDDD